jgi:hypothetical protein
MRDLRNSHLDLLRSLIMTRDLPCCALLLWVLVFAYSVAAASEPVGFFEVVAVTPSRVINHEVDLKGRFDSGVTETFLKGPVLFSHAVGFGDEAVQLPNAYLNWYKIEKPVSEPRRTLSVRDSLRGNEKVEVTVENSAFLLSPSQRVTAGPPSRVPDGLNHFKAYRIVNSPKMQRELHITGAFGPEDRVTTKAALLCVPVEQWHHDEHSTVKNPTACLMVYELQPVELDSSITTIDQFGLNQLKASSGNWLCVPAQMGKPSSTDGE